jgi:endonuclease III
VKNIEKYINTISFFRNKAKNIFKTCEILVEKKLEDFDTLEKLVELH